MDCEPFIKSRGRKAKLEETKAARNPSRAKSEAKFEETKAAQMPLIKSNGALEGQVRVLTRDKGVAEARIRDVRVLTRDKGVAEARIREVRVLTRDKGVAEARIRDVEESLAVFRENVRVANRATQQVSADGEANKGRVFALQKIIHGMQQETDCLLRDR
ncbi:hypothetical protein T484DRAFT_1807445, partial [Baffinella frigidus]